MDRKCVWQRQRRATQQANNAVAAGAAIGVCTNIWLNSIEFILVEMCGRAQTHCDPALEIEHVGERENEVYNNIY